MKKKLSIIEFEEYQRKSSFNCYIFDTANQVQVADSMLRMNVRFNEMKIGHNPNTVCLLGHNKMDKMIFDRVKCVNVEEKAIGTIMEFCCGNLSDEAHNKSYIVVAQ